MTGTVLNCGYVPLIDCAPLVIASELGFAAEEGLDLNLVRQPSWSALRDMLALGHLDAAQMLSPLPIAMSLGMGGLDTKIDCLLVLSVNGTVFGVSNAVKRVLGPVPFGAPRQVLESLAGADIGPLRIGVPFPFSMHHILLRYWLASRPEIEVQIVTVPPQRMADAMADGQIDAFWVGEPWGSDIVHRGVGQMLMTGSDIWQTAPEKVLAARHDWVEEHPHLTRRLMRAVYHAGRWLGSPRNTPLAIEILGRSEHLNLSSDLIDPAMTQYLTPYLGAEPVPVARFLSFHSEGATYPWRSQAAFIASRLGADGQGIAHAKACFRSDLYDANLGPMGASVPESPEKIEGGASKVVPRVFSPNASALSRHAFFDGKSFDFRKG